MRLKDYDIHLPDMILLAAVTIVGLVALIFDPGGTKSAGLIQMLAGSGMVALGIKIAYREYQNEA